MKIKLDENLPAELADDLRRAGHDAMTVVEQGLSGAEDQALMAAVQVENRVLITMDKGIANVRTYSPQTYAGIVLLRPGQTGRGAVLEFARQNMPAILPLVAPGKLIVVSKQGIRIR